MSSNNDNCVNDINPGGKIDVLGIIVRCGTFLGGHSVEGYHPTVGLGDMTCLSREEGLVCHGYLSSRKLQY